MSPRRLFVVAFALLAVALALHAYRYYPFVTDETLASLRYASRFANGEGLTFSDGERVEGYTNFLFVVLNALLQRVGIDAITGARVLGFGGVLLAIASVGLEPRGSGLSLQRLVVGGVLLVATAPLVIWSVGGLEAGLVAGLVALSFRLLERSALSNDRRPWLAGLPLALLVLVRADGFLLALALLAGAACLPRPSAASLRRVVRHAVPGAVALVAHLGFRLAYYRDWLPNPARLADPQRFSHGLEAAGGGYASASMLVLLAVVASVLTARRGERFRLAMPWAVVAATTLAVVAGGADPAPGHRGFLAALTALCFIATDEVGDDWSRIAKERVLVLPILALCAFLHATQSSETADSRRARTDRSALDGLAVGRTLGGAFSAKRVLLAVDTPGALAFGAELPTLDLTGMHGPSPGRMDVIRRAPDLVAFGPGPGKAEPKTALGLGLTSSRRFRDAYQWISVDGTPEASASGEIWVRRERGKLGIGRTPERIEVPGYFFTGEASRALAALSHDSLVAELTEQAPGVLPELDLPAGRYRFEFLPSEPAPAVDVRCRDVSMRRSEGAESLVFEVDGKIPVSIVVAPAADARRLRLRRVALVRVTDVPATLRCAPRGRPLEVSAALVSRANKPRNLWLHPAHVAFSGDGVVVHVGELASARGIELSLSRESAYFVELRRDRRAVFTTSVEGGGKRRILATHRFELPKLEAGGSYELFIKPRRGDSLSTLGHVTFF